MRRSFIAALQSVITVLLILFLLFAFCGAPYLLSTYSAAEGAGEDSSVAARATTDSMDKNKPAIMLAQQSQPLPPAASTKDARVEARIESLHDRLKITSAEEPQWSDVAQAMRDNAQQMSEVIEQRQQARSMTAVDDLKTYQRIADAHAQGLKKLIQAFQTLYDNMSDSQKKNADAILSKNHHDKKSAAQSG
jgi:hypothetical protein